VGLKISEFHRQSFSRGSKLSGIRTPASSASMVHFREPHMRRSCYFLPVLVVALICAATLPARGQTYTETVLHDFCTQTGCPDGDLFPSGLIQASDGNFYGTTGSDGPNGQGGTVFKMSPSGQFTTMYGFCGLPNCVDGDQSQGALVEGSDGNFYGTTVTGGKHSYGTVFRITPTGVLTTLYNFCSQANCADGEYPGSSLIQGTDGNFYGVAWGGANQSGCAFDQGCGIVFKITPSGTLTTIYNFNGAAYGTGYGPFASLVQGTDGNFYGQTVYGSNANCNVDYGAACGVVFKLTPSGAYTPLYDLEDISDAGLAEGMDGNFYGSGYNGSAVGIFRITPSGTLTELGGDQSFVTLLLGTDGNFYGAIPSAESPDDGSILRFALPNAFTTIYNFCSLAACADGADPSGGAPLIQGADGNFYDTTSFGGNTTAPCPEVGNGCGAIYRITASPALPAPVQVSISPSSISLGNSFTLTWQVLNASSETMQQCYAHLPFNTSAAGNWSGLQAGVMSGGVYSGSTTIQPTADGVYVYALTCGGVESGSAYVQVGNGKSNSVTTLATNSPVYATYPVTLSVSVAPEPDLGALSGTVAFSFGNTSLGTLTLSGGAANLNLDTTSLPAGTYPITAAYSGNATYLPSSETVNVVIKPFITGTTLTITPTTVTQGQSVTLTGSVARTVGTVSPTGTVTFSSRGVVLGSATLKNGAATLILPTNLKTPAGAFPVIATYSGDSIDLSSASAAASVTILHATNATLTVSPTTVASGQLVTFKAKVSRADGQGFPTGSVEFLAGATELGVATLSNGVATVAAYNTGFLPVGTYGVTAAYEGDSTDGISVSSPVTVTVYPPGDATETLLTVTPTTVNQDQTITLSSTVKRTSASGAPTGTVTFYLATAELAVATLSNGKAGTTLTVPTTVLPGKYAIRADYNGDSSDQVSSSGPVNLTVFAATNLSLTITPNPAPADSAVSLSATVKQTYGSAIPTGTVAFSANGSSVGSATLSGSGDAILDLSDFGIPPGTYPITAAYSGDSANAASSATKDVTIQ
jgi:uncharacterized repeat protein (TIGR03803 family)